MNLGYSHTIPCMYPSYSDEQGPPVHKGENQMKVGIATTLSIAGVLAAGASAFAVNTSVLGSSSPVASSIVGAANSQGADNIVLASNSGAVSEQSGPTPISSSAVSNSVTTYQVGSSGSVVIDTTSGAIVVTNVMPAAGWTSEPARTEPNGDVKVHFLSSDSRVEFVARLINGKVEISATTDTRPAVNTPPNGSGVAPAPAANPTKPSASYSEKDDDHKEDGDDREDHEHERDGDDD